MDTIGKAFGAGIVFFTIVVAGLVGSKADQTTIALLGGTFIGLLVAIPATLLVVLIARRRDDEARQRGAHIAAPSLPQQGTWPVAIPQRRFYRVVACGDVTEIDGINNGEAYRRLNDVSDRIEATLLRHGAPCTVVGGRVFDGWVEYLMRPACSTTVSQVRARQADLALALGNSNTRVTQSGTHLAVQIPRLVMNQHHQRSLIAK